MSLRTLVARLRERDWTSVIIEVLIVVAGVFIGLQVTNWNEDRKDTRRGNEYLRRLHDELLQDALYLRDIAAFWRQVGDYGAAALTYAEDGTLYRGSAWETLLAYYQASQVWPYRKPDVTFEEIRGSGNLLLIRDATLRARIAKHYGADAGSQVVEVLGLIPDYRERVRGMTPWRIQRYIWAECYSSDGAMQTLKDCAPPVSEAEALGVLDQYRQSRELTEDLRFWMVNVYNGGLLMKSVEADATTLAQDIASELDR